MNQNVQATLAGLRREALLAEAAEHRLASTVAKGEAWPRQAWRHVCGEVLPRMARRALRRGHPRPRPTTISLEESCA
jgi:hypothetical protein